ncbi:MAG TPA: hypothetical protein VGM82_24315 [Gemmatimonadaceae bacterium]|jgi:hypothetical protein
MKRVQKLIVLRCVAIAVFATPAIVAAQTSTTAPPPPPSCASDPAFHVLDFWVGSWTVVDSTGANVGTNRIEKILDGCAVTELWHEPNGDEGRSLFYYVPAQRQWKQVWITPAARAPGGLKEKFLLHADAKSVRFQGEIIGQRGAIILDRTTLSRVADGRVRQQIEISRDGGTSWEMTFDATYIRR